MTSQISFQFNPSFYKKTNPAIIKKCVAKTIKDTTLEAEKRCKEKAPYQTGNLRRSHSSKYSADEGTVHNSATYAVYVITGTYKMPARNYPSEVCKELGSEKYMANRFRKHLRDEGVTK
jgi:hypothetical protein